MNLYHRAVTALMATTIICIASPITASAQMIDAAIYAQPGAAPLYQVAADQWAASLASFIVHLLGNVHIRAGVNLASIAGSFDTTPPTMPTNLSAIPAATSIALGWTPSADAGGVASYKVFRNGTQIGIPSSSAYTDTGLVPSTLYAYDVAAVDGTGNVSSVSSLLSTTTLAGPDTYGTTWNPVNIYGGGWIVGMDIAPDGTKVARADVFGAYLWDGTQWDQLVTAQSMPAGTNGFGSGQQLGAYEIRVAPSMTTRFYMIWNGYLYRTDSRGASWIQLSNFNGGAQLNITADTFSNGAYRYYGSKMAIDPSNANVLYVSTPATGVQYTTDGGMTWHSVSVLGTDSGTEGYSIAFDPVSSIAKGVTQGIYIAKYGSGVYHSTNGGSTWNLLSGGPTSFAHMIVAQDGTLYMTSGVAYDDTLYVYSGGSWSSVSVGTSSSHSRYPMAIAVDPANANRVVVANIDGSLSISTNHGVSFSGYQTSWTISSPSTPWLASTGQYYMSVGNIMFDPTGTNKLYEDNGVGVMWTNPSDAGSAPTWNTQTNGIRELTTNLIVSPPGAPVQFVSWDFAVFSMATPTTTLTAYGPSSGTVVPGWDLDYASNNPSFLSEISNSAGVGDYSAYSTNGGATWTQFPTKPADIGSAGCGSGWCLGGSMAAASSTNILWFPSNNSPGYYTLNGGNTWNVISISGVSNATTSATGWGSNYTNKRHIVAADRVNIGTFYAYNYGGSSSAGVYKTTNGGVSWTQVYSGNVTANDQYGAVLKAVPGRAGELFFTPGFMAGGTLTSPINLPFMHSIDGGATWTAVSNVEEVTAFGFGKAASGTTTPALYIAGYVNSNYGIYESDNDGMSWTQIGLFPLNDIDGVASISGDMNIYGRVYASFFGSSFLYGDMR